MLTELHYTLIAFWDESIRTLALKAPRAGRAALRPE
jgi:hypothetical protein